MEENAFVEGALPIFVLRPLPKAVMDEYRRPFRDPGEGRRPTLAWPREVPLDGAPGDVAAAITLYAAWLAQCDVPTLFVNTEQGVFVAGDVRASCRAWSNRTEVTVAGAYFVQEDAPEGVGRAVADRGRTLA